MTFLENVLAGLVVAVLSWAVHKARTQWLARRNLSQRRETPAMGKHLDPDRRDLPIGPQRELAELLIELFNESGLSYRELADRASISTGTVNKILKKRDLASKEMTMAAAGQLTLRAVGTRAHLDAAAADQALVDYTRKIQDLYERAASQGTVGAQVEEAARGLWNELVGRPGRSELGDRVTLDVHRAIRKSRLASVIIDRYDRRSVGLGIEVPDMDSYWALTDEGGPWDSDRSWHEEFEDLLSRRLGMFLTVTPICIPDFPVE